MTFSAEQIAHLAGGRIEGNADAAVSGFGKIEEAQPGQLAFLANPKYEDYLYTTGASIVIVNDSLQLRQPVEATLIRVPDAYTAFAALLSAYENLSMKQQPLGIEQPVSIHETAVLGEGIYLGSFTYLGRNVRIGNRVKIYPHCYVGDDVIIGDDAVLNSGVKLYNKCVIGKRVIIHAGCVLGSDGFGFAPQADGSFKKVPQLGNVVVEDDVEIGANTTVDRATIGSTLLKAGAKIDNLVQLAHNVEVGNSTVIAAQAGISGSTRIGSGVMIGGQAGVVGHIHIGDGARINAQSGVSKSLDKNKAVTGTPAFDYTAALRSQAAARKLPELERRVKELERLLGKESTGASEEL